MWHFCCNAVPSSPFAAESNGTFWSQLYGNFNGSTNESSALAGFDRGAALALRPRLFAVGACMACCQHVHAVPLTARLPLLQQACTTPHAL